MVGDWGDIGLVGRPQPVRGGGAQGPALRDAAPYLSISSKNSLGPAASAPGVGSGASEACRVASTGAPGLTLAGLLRRGRQYLRVRDLEEWSLEAEVLLMRLKGIPRAYLYSHQEEKVELQDEAAYQALLDRRASREPLAYITGTREFFGLDFSVDQRVLIPRPETEMLVEECLRFVSREGLISPVLADIGTGSGAIAVSLAVRLTEARIYAIDASRGALEVAFLNCALHHAQERVTILQGDLLASLPEPVDIIIANLPYVPTSILATLAPEVAAFEPRLALDGGDDGLDLVRRLLDQAPGALRPRGRILMEIEAGQGAEASRAAGDRILGANVRILRDLSGRDRVLVVELA